MSENLEYKFVQEVKAEADADGKMRFSGYLAAYGNVDKGGDIIKEGAFKESIEEIMDEGIYVPVLEQHGWLGTNGYNPIGYYELLKEDKKGLWARGVLIPTDAGKNMYITLKETPNGFMGQSIGYEVRKASYPNVEETRKIGVRRYLEKLGLFEGSVVTFPMNKKARVEDVKAASLFWRQLENKFRENGFSKNDAVKAVSLVKSATPNREFSMFLAQCGNIIDKQPEKEQKEILEDGANKLLDVFKQAKLDSDIEKFLNVFNNFSMTK